MLTDAQCRNATCPPDKKHVRFSDAGGLYLEVTPARLKRWFLKYRLVVDVNCLDRRAVGVVVIPLRTAA